MVHVVGSAMCAIVLAWCVSTALAWWKAYALAKTSKLQVFLSPVHVRDMWWLALHPLLVPVLKHLPKWWTNPWLSMAQVFDIWKTGYKPFAEIGSDTFMLSTPRGNILWTCDPEVCYQLEYSYPKLQKATEMLKFLDIWGPTVASVEGKTWRTHRKVVMSAFNPSTNAAVWQETTEQTRTLMYLWEKQGNIVKQAQQWTSRLALHVISAIFYSKSLTWSNEDHGIETPPPGYELSFEQALFTVLRRLGILLMTPRQLLASLPIKSVQETHTAFIEFTKYMHELIGSTTNQINEIISKQNKNVLEAIVIAGSSSTVLDGEPAFTEANIMGNVFFLLSAGHETTGNTMAFALNLLALFPAYQEKVQRELSLLLGERPRGEWTVEREYRALQKGWMGAFLKEVLRLYCVVQWLPRVATVAIDVVETNGTTHTIPKDTMCIFNFSAAFRNPSIWHPADVSTSRRAQLHNSPAIDFDPSRWLKQDSPNDEAPEQSAPLHFPFGQGPHACPGRTFALVEMTAMLSLVLLHYKLELVVDEKIKRECGGNEKLALEKTSDQAFRTLVDDITTNQNIELRKELPIRLVKRS